MLSHNHKTSNSQIIHNIFWGKFSSNINYFLYDQYRRFQTVEATIRVSCYSDVCLFQSCVSYCSRACRVPVVCVVRRVAVVCTALQSCELCSNSVYRSAVVCIVLQWCVLCYSGVCVVLQWCVLCYSGVCVVLQWCVLCYSGVCVVLQWRVLRSTGVCRITAVCVALHGYVSCYSSVCRVTVVCEPTCAWNGELPPKTTKSNQGYSCKVFLGGVPWDVTEGKHTYLSRDMLPSKRSVKPLKWIPITWSVRTFRRIFC